MSLTFPVIVGLAVGTALGQRDGARALAAGRLDTEQAGYLKERIRQFGDSDPARRRSAVLELAGAGDAAVALVLESNRGTSNPLMIRSGVLALGEIGTRTALDALRREYLRGDLREAERTVAILLLGQLGPGPAQGAIRSAALSKRPSLERLAAVLALGFQRDLEGIQAALSGLSKEPLELRRIVVLLAAGVCGARQLLPELVPYLRDDAQDVRRAAAFAMAEVADPSVLQPLLEALRRERDDRVRVALALALGVLEDPASAAALVSLVGARAAELRSAALVALASRADGVEPVLRALGDVQDPERLAEIALAVAAAPEQRFGAALSALLDSRHPGVRGAAGLSLAAQRTTDQAQPLLVWLKAEKDRGARLAAVLTVGLLAPPGAQEIVADNHFRCSDAQLLRRVRRTLEDRSDPRLLRDRLERELRTRQARLIDRLDRLLRDLVETGFGLQQISRHVSVLPGDPRDLPDAGGRSRLARIDRRNSSVERDLKAWFSERSYFGSWQERRRRGE